MPLVRPHPIVFEESRAKKRFDSSIEAFRDNVKVVPFAVRYEGALEHWHNAHKAFEDRRWGDTLHTSRNCLENAIATLTSEHDIEIPKNENGKRIDLYAQIDLLEERGLYGSSTTALLHKLRQHCNRGSHDQVEAPPTKEEAEFVLVVLDEAVEQFRTIAEKTIIASAGNSKNRPMKFPTYYDRTRPFIGEWLTCYSASDLLMKSSYSQQLSKANDGDIEAMLNLAIGFIPAAGCNWNEKQYGKTKYRTYVNFPRYKSKKGDISCDQTDCPDVRYYYWLSKAIGKAVELYDLGAWENVPKIHLVTALCEVIKYHFFCYPSKLNTLVSGSSWDYDNKVSLPDERNQYSLVEEMFEEAIPSISLFDTCFLLISFLEQYGNQILSPIHAECTSDHLKYLMYVWATYMDWFAYFGGRKRDFYAIRPWFALKTQDIGVFPTFELLKARCVDDTCGLYLNRYIDIIEFMVNHQARSLLHMKKQNAISNPELYKQLDADFVTLVAEPKRRKTEKLAKLAAEQES